MTYNHAHHHPLQRHQLVYTTQATQNIYATSSSLLDTCALHPRFLNVTLLSTMTRAKKGQYATTGAKVQSKKYHSYMSTNDSCDQYIASTAECPSEGVESWYLASISTITGYYIVKWMRFTQKMQK